MSWQTYWHVSISPGYGYVRITVYIRCLSVMHNRCTSYVVITFLEDVKAKTRCGGKPTGLGAVRNASGHFPKDAIRYVRHIINQSCYPRQCQWVGTGCRQAVESLYPMPLEEESPLWQNRHQPKEWHRRWNHHRQQTSCGGDVL